MEFRLRRPLILLRTGSLLAPVSEIVHCVIAHLFLHLCLRLSLLLWSVVVLVLHFVVVVVHVGQVVGLHCVVHVVDWILWMGMAARQEALIEQEVDVHELTQCAFHQAGLTFTRIDEKFCAIT